MQNKWSRVRYRPEATSIWPRFTYGSDPLSSSRTSVTTESHHEPPSPPRVITSRRQWRTYAIMNQGRHEPAALRS
ncbi:hypothetical protein TanjilG_22672 [Lupinus angustifolius]|uniref:Uncharacterized protein n=1 Tax=Lupinus angustifolius TaxID=3871 RepID=A0A1J7G4W7_LUPAN|nr:hypothetical protein TanjilG_22672 [Lupinus angustifolius]